uniref:Uncharacterized protein n=1 Tax=Ditylenchus dipsaci TaxID=166011 RepID=A0A915DEJ1_9BILA
MYTNSKARAVFGISCEGRTRPLWYLYWSTIVQYRHGTGDSTSSVLTGERTTGESSTMAAEEETGAGTTWIAELEDSSSSSSA